VHAVLGDLAQHPRRQREGLVSAFEFELGQDQPRIRAGELIDFPGQPIMEDEVAGLLDQRRIAQTVEHQLGVSQRDAVFELIALDARAFPLDGQIGAIAAVAAAQPHPRVAQAVGKEVTLPNHDGGHRPAVGIQAPGVTLDEEFAFDFERHVDDLWRLIRSTLWVGQLRERRIGGCEHVKPALAVLFDHHLRESAARRSISQTAHQGQPYPVGP
jgi:hypothetical protein